MCKRSDSMIGIARSRHNTVGREEAAKQGRIPARAHLHDIACCVKSSAGELMIADGYAVGPVHFAKWLVAQITDDCAYEAGYQAGRTQMIAISRKSRAHDRHVISPATLVLPYVNAHFVNATWPRLQRQFHLFPICFVI